MASASHAAAVQLLIRPSTTANRSVRAWPGDTAPRSGATQGAWGRGLAPSVSWGGRRFYGQSLVFPALAQIRIKTLNFQSIAFSLFGVVTLGSLRGRAGVVDSFILRVWNLWVWRRRELGPEFPGLREEGAGRPKSRV